MTALFFLFESQIIRLPVNPAEIRIRQPGRNALSETIGAGEINQLRPRGLCEISISSFFPGIGSRFAEDGALGTAPTEYVRFFTKARDSKKPLSLFAEGFELNLLVSVEYFEYACKAGEEDDIYYTVQLKEFREHDAERLFSTQQDLSVQSVRTAAVKKPVVGASVTVNGRLYRDSGGSGAGKVLQEYTGKLSLIKAGKPCPYHVATVAGGALGWVSEQSVRLV